LLHKISEKTDNQAHTIISYVTDGAIAL